MKKYTREFIPDNCKFVTIEKHSQKSIDLKLNSIDELTQRNDWY